MSFKSQITKIKENWLLFLLPVLLIIVLFTILPMVTNSVGSVSRDMVTSQNYSKSLAYDSDYYGGGYDYYNENFAPEVEERKIIKNSNLGIEIKKDEFSKTEILLKNIIKSNNALILNENVYENSNKLKTGSYNIKVESTKLDSFNKELKTLGKVLSFSESGNDITGDYLNLETQIEVEKEKLQRYNDLYNNQSTSFDNKVDLVDRIFNQERLIKNLEDNLKNKDKKIEYSTVSLNITEKSNYVHITFVKFSNLVKTLVGSLNSLLYILFGIIPYVVFLFIIIGFVKLTRRCKHKFKHK